MRFIKKMLGCVLVGICLTASAQSPIKLENAPTAKDGALTLQDIPPVFARPFTTPPHPQDDKVVSNEKELFKEEMEEPVEKKINPEINYR